jgi:hypothetical protein
MLTYSLLFVALTFTAPARSARPGVPLSVRDATSAIVSLDYATYEGIRDGSGVDSYLGMRYAAPPLGELRFRGPRDPYLETQVQQAKAVSSSWFRNWTCICRGKTDIKMPSMLRFALV